MIRKLTLYLFMLGFMLLLLEGLAFVATLLVDRDDFFDSRQAVLGRLDEAGLAEFSKRAGDPVIGWLSTGPLVREDDNCLGESIRYSYGAAGERLHDGFDPSTTGAIAVGDSYTNGDEVGDSETYPARLAERLGVSVANHGVGGYGPAQSLLNLERNIGRYPQVEVVILGIMYENIFRMVNSYRPVLYTNSSDYTLKPYMAGGELVPHPGQPALESLEQFKRVAETSFDHDFWAKPVARFPYSLALARSLGSNYFRYRRLQKAFRTAGEPEYSLAFDANEIKLNLIALLNRYASLAREWRVRPVVIFIPRNRFDTQSATSFIEENRSEIDPALLVGDVARSAAIDWAKFNLEEADSDNICHPSPYGYQAIADYIARFLRDNDAWPSRATGPS